MSLHVHLPTDFLMWDSMWDRGILLAGWILWEMWECRNVGSWVLYKESHRFFWELHLLISNWQVGFLRCLGILFYVFKKFCFIIQIRFKVRDKFLIFFLTLVRWNWIKFCKKTLFFLKKEKKTVSST